MATQGIPSVTPEEKRINIIIAVIAIIVAIVFAIYSWQVLPEQVANQPAAFDTGAPPIPKIVAVLLPFGISVGSAIMSVNYRKQALVCLVGYALNILFWISN